MMLNAEKSKFMIFNRAQADFNTRLSLNGKNLEQISVVKLLGIILTENLKYEENTNHICKRAFARISMVTKLKYVGVPLKDLIDVYILFVRSLLEYCSVVWHSSLTLEQSYNIERVQRTALKVILGGNYSDYDSALKECGLFYLREAIKSNNRLNLGNHPNPSLLGLNWIELGLERKNNFLNFFVGLN